MDTERPSANLSVGVLVLVFDPDRKQQPPVEARITKIGRVYVFATDVEHGWSDWRFRIDSQSQSTGIGHGGYFFRTRQQHSYHLARKSALDNLFAHGLELPRSWKLPDLHLFAVSKLLTELDGIVAECTETKAEI